MARELRILHEALAAEKEINDELKQQELEEGVIKRTVRAYVGMEKDRVKNALSLGTRILTKDHDGGLDTMKAMVVNDGEAMEEETDKLKKKIDKIKNSKYSDDEKKSRMKEIITKSKEAMKKRAGRKQGLLAKIKKHDGKFYDKHS
jgi:uncharacterized protein (UPF0332 family)